MTIRTYAAPEQFKQALEQRLRADGGALARRRQLLVFDRFLARIAASFDDAAVLKGGLVLELRLQRARTTRDVDLRLQGSANGLLPRLQACGRLDLRDFMTFEIVQDPHHPEIQNDGLIYEGQRFRGRCVMAGKLYGEPFGVDIVHGEPMHGRPEPVTTHDTLAFAGIPPPTVYLYPVETHIAEKLHAYTLPRTRPNSRVKDLPDIALLATARDIYGAALRAALEQTFGFRNTHRLPSRPPDPPPEWAKPYQAIAQADGLSWLDLASLTRATQSFIDPVLSQSVPDSLWVASQQLWSTQRPSVESQS